MPFWATIIVWMWKKKGTAWDMGEKSFSLDKMKMIRRNA